MDARHEPDVQRPAARQDLEILALAAQQDQRGRVARAHNRLAHLAGGFGNIIHRKRWKR